MAAINDKTFVAAGILGNDPLAAGPALRAQTIPSSKIAPDPRHYIWTQPNGDWPLVVFMLLNLRRLFQRQATVFARRRAGFLWCKYLWPKIRADSIIPPSKYFYPPSFCHTLALPKFASMVPIRVETHVTVANWAHDVNRICPHCC